MRGEPAIVATGVRRGTPVASALLLIVFQAAAAVTSAQEESRTRVPYTVTRATSEITIDGVIDEQAWQDALTLELNYEVRPGENTEPPVRTVVFITYDEGRVLAAFRAYDDEPDKIRARYRDRDQVGGDDYVGMTLDTFNDERRAYEFMVNPRGGQSDGIYTDLKQNYDEAWDGIWVSAGRLTDFGYEVEIAIPFNQIRFQPVTGRQIWGLDLTRRWPRTNQVHIGLFPRDPGGEQLPRSDREDHRIRGRFRWSKPGGLADAHRIRSAGASGLSTLDRGREQTGPRTGRNGDLGHHSEYHIHRRPQPRLLSDRGRRRTAGPQ